MLECEWKPLLSNGILGSNGLMGKSYGIRIRPSYKSNYLEHCTNTRVYVYLTNSLKTNKKINIVENNRTILQNLISSENY